jgi:hypothetical protein
MSEEREAPKIEASAVPFPFKHRNTIVDRRGNAAWRVVHADVRVKYADLHGSFSIALASFTNLLKMAIPGGNPCHPHLSLVQGQHLEQRGQLSAAFSPVLWR